jgi:all-trans-retinol 13,14-reductase
LTAGWRVRQRADWTSAGATLILLVGTRPESQLNQVHDPTARTKERTKTAVPPEVDVAIVGAGMGGLTAGAFLARRGLRVAIFDQHYVAGGCCTQFARNGDDGRYVFDIGLHYVGDCGPNGVIPSVLAEVGVEQEFEPLDPDGYDVLIFPDFRFPIPVGLQNYRDRLVEFFPEERRGIDKWIRFINQVEQAVGMARPRDFDINPLQGLSILFKAPLAALWKYRSLVRVLDSCTKNPHLRAVLAGQHGDYGMPPGETAALFHAGLVGHFTSGAYYPKGGGQGISDKLADAVEAAGGTICLRTGISEIIVEGGRAVGVRTDEGKAGSQEIRAKVVLSNADPTQTLLNLVGPEHLPKKTVDKVKGWVHPAALFLVCLGVKDDLAARGMRAANYWTVDGYDLDALYQAGRDEIGVHGAYITSATMKDPNTPGHAPEGVHNVEVMTLVRGEAERWDADPVGIEERKYRRNEGYQELKQRIEDELIERFDGVFPGAAEHIVFKESASPVTHTRFTRSPAGSGYGIAITPKQFESRRIHPRGPIGGLYMCGASGRHHLGVMGAMLSGRDAARRILEDLPARALATVPAS